MHELIRDEFYETLKQYDRTVIDYCLMENDSSDRGYLSHKEAVLFAMGRLTEQYPWISIDPDKASAVKISQEKMLFFPAKPRKETSSGTIRYQIDFRPDGRIPYWYAFVRPPHGTGPVVRNGKTVRQEYGREDFEAVNRALFPQGTDELEVYEWSTDWSNYFNAGKEWWGTICCSIYDKKMKRYAVLMASSTD